MWLVLGGIATVLVGLLTNWLYDLLRKRSVVPDEPRPKHLVVGAVLLVASLLVLGLIASGDQEADDTASTSEAASSVTFHPRDVEGEVAILQASPDPDTDVLQSGLCTAVEVQAEYRLPVPVANAEIALGYAYGDRNVQVQSFPASPGDHQVDLSGHMYVPRSAVEDEDFTIRVSLGGQDAVRGDRVQIAAEERTYSAEPGPRDDVAGPLDVDSCAFHRQDEVNGN